MHELQLLLALRLVTVEVRVLQRQVVALHLRIRGFENNETFVKVRASLNCEGWWRGLHGSPVLVIVWGTRLWPLKHIVSIVSDYRLR